MSMSHDRKYIIQMIVVFLLTISLMISDPLHYKGKDLRHQEFVPTMQWLTRLKDPLKNPMKNNLDLEKMPKFTRIDKEKTTGSKDVYNFVLKQTFTDSITTFKDISANYISPHTRAMVLMGCYGDPVHTDEMHDPEVLEMSKNKSTAFMLNIILQTWEEEHNQKITVQNSEGSQIQNDRSVCSCMKDFATPLLLTSKTKDDDEEFLYDSCLLQNLVDYTSDEFRRQRLDPMKIELLNYEYELMQYYPGNISENKTNENGTTTTITTSVFSNVTMSKATKDHPVLAYVQRIIDRRSHPHGDQYLWQFLARLESHHIDEMFPHNKLRTPSSGENTDALKLSQAPPTVSLQSFKLYMHKYKETLQVCAHNGVPAYQTHQLVFLSATKFWKLGVIFLLAAATIGFSTVHACEEQKPEPESSSTKWPTFLVGVLTRILITFAIFVVLISISADLSDEKPAPEKQTLLSFIMVLWWIFAGFVVISFARNIWFSYWSKKCTDKDRTDVASKEDVYVFTQISQDVCIIGGLANLSVSLLLHRGESDEYVVTTCYIIFITLGFIQHISNLVRMMQLYTKEALKSANHGGNSTYKIAYNRVLVLALIAVGLLAYVMLASSSLQAWSADVLYGYQRVRVFAICAFFIFSTFDVFFEVLVAMKVGEESTYVSQHPQKMMWTSWVIIVSLLVLDMHEYAALCTSTVQGAETESLCNPWHYFFGQVDWSGASTHMKI